MKAYYGAESTANPIWLAQRKEKMGIWETITVFHCRKWAEDWLIMQEHNLGKFGTKTRVWSVPLKDEKLAEKMRELVAEENPEFLR